MPVVKPCVCFEIIKFYRLNKSTTTGNFKRNQTHSICPDNLKQINTVVYQHWIMTLRKTQINRMLHFEFLPPKTKPTWHTIICLLRPCYFRLTSACNYSPLLPPLTHPLTSWCGACQASCWVNSLSPKQALFNSCVSWIIKIFNLFALVLTT